MKITLSDCSYENDNEVIISMKITIKWLLLWKCCEVTTTMTRGSQEPV